MKKIYLAVIIISLIVLGLFFLRFIIGGDEDSWIKDSRGVWVKHGNPSLILDYVIEQKNIINCSKELYDNFKESGTEINSQCLGNCEDYAVDIVNVPRTKQDNLIENQCADYREGKVSHFIELDKNGEIVRIV